MIPHLITLRVFFMMLYNSIEGLMQGNGRKRVDFGSKRYCEHISIKRKV